MKDNYKITVNDSIDFELNKEKVDNFDMIKVQDGSYHILHNNKAYKGNLIQSDFDNKEYTVSINSNFYKVKISDSLDMLIEKLGLSVGVEKELNEIVAPIPGVVTEISVREGDIIKEGDPLLVLEAMKMENTISSHRDAVIKKISVKEGGAVEKGKLLIEFD